MASRTDDLPSCSKMPAEGTKVEDIIINKIPVVMLTKLDPDIVSMKVITVSETGTEKQKASTTTAGTKKPEVKKKRLLSDNDSLSDVSITFSDSEDTAKELTGNKITKKGGKDNTSKDGKRGKSETSGVKNRNGNVFSSQKAGAQKKAGHVAKTYGDPEGRQSSQSYRHKALKRSGESAEGDYSSLKKAKTEMTVEKIIGSPRQVSMSKPDKPHNCNARYKLTLGPFNASALHSELFRKFINLAADCVVSFNVYNKSTAIGANGSVDLFFGDYFTLQSAMQRLCQLPGYADKSVPKGADKSVVKGIITCLEIKPVETEKNKWQALFSAKMLFQFNTDMKDKLELLIANKGRKTEDTKRKCVQLHQIPSSITEEMLTLLFPFSIGVKISDTDSSKDFKGPVDIEFENQEWLEAVLVCFQKFAVSISQPYDRLTNLVIKNFTLPNEKTQENSPVFKHSKQFTRGFNRGGRFQRGKPIVQNRNLPNSVPDRNLSAFNQRVLANRGGFGQNRFEDKKRGFPAPILAHRGINRQVMMANRGRLGILQARSPVMAERNRGDVQSHQHEAREDALRKIALAKGLDPSNPDVVKILEMTTHLEHLQSMVIQQKAEARTFEILQGQRAANERRLQLQQQMLVMKQAQKEAGARRFLAAQQSQGSRSFEAPQKADNSWPRSDILRYNWEKAQEREEEDRRRLAQEMEEENRRRLAQKMEEEDRRRRAHEREEQDRKRLAQEREEEDRRRRAQEREEEDRRRRAQEREEEDRRRRAQEREEEDRRQRAQEREEEDRRRREEFEAAHIKTNIVARLHNMSGAEANSNRGRRFQNNVRMNSSKFATKVADKTGDIKNTNILPFGDAPATKGLLGVAPNVAPDLPRAARSDEQKEMYPQRGAKLKQTYRNEDNRESENVRFSGRRSRWNSDREMEDGYNTVDQMALDPGRNDRPLDFNRQPSRLSAEQAFKQDIERTKAALSSHPDALAGRPFNSGGLLDTSRSHFEEVRERHALPLQFGKNAVKKTPKEIEEERRRSVEMNMNTGMERNPRKFGGIKAVSKNFPSAVGGKDRSLMERTDYSAAHNRDLASREDLVPPRAAAAFLRTSADVPRGGINVRGAQRGRSLQRGQPPSLLSKPQPSEHDNLEYDVQWGRNQQEKPRSRAHDALRAQGEQTWQGAQERQEIYEFDQGNLFAEADIDYRRNEQRRPAGSSGYRASQEYNVHAEVAALPPKPSLVYEDEQFEGYFGADKVKKPYEARETFKRAEAKYGFDYGEYEEQDYAAQTGFDTASASAGYPGRGGLREAARPVGRGGLLAQGRELSGGLLSNRGGRSMATRGGGVLSARGGGALSARGGGALSARGGGALSARGGGALSARGGGALSPRRGGVPSPRGGGIAVRGGRGDIVRPAEPGRGRGALNLRGNTGRPSAGRGDGLLPMPKELEDYYSEGAYTEEAGEDFLHFQPQHQHVGRNRIQQLLSQPPPLLGQGSGHGVNFF